MSDTKTMVNEIEGIDPIKEQTIKVLDLVKDHFEKEINYKEDYVEFLKEKSKNLDNLFYEETDLFELNYLNDLINKLLKDMEMEEWLK